MMADSISGSLPSSTFSCFSQLRLKLPFQPLNLTSALNEVWLTMENTPPESSRSLPELRPCAPAIFALATRMARSFSLSSAGGVGFCASRCLRRCSIIELMSSAGGGGNGTFDTSGGVKVSSFGLSRGTSLLTTRLLGAGGGFTLATFVSFGLGVGFGCGFGCGLSFRGAM